MKSSLLLSSGLALAFFYSAGGAVAAPAADSALVLSPVFPAAQVQRGSYLRFINLGAVDGNVSVVIKTGAGVTLGTYTRAIAADTAPQIGMSDIEAALSSAPNANTPLRLEVTADFYGAVQHAIYNPEGGALTNLSNCGASVVVDARTLTNVHTTLLQNSFPSSVVIANRGTIAGAATLAISDSATGQSLGTYTSVVVPAGGHILVPMIDIQQAINFAPSANQYHLTVKLTGAFMGALSHLVDNFGAGAITDMTQRCEVRPTLVIPDITDRLSMAGVWQPVSTDQTDSVVGSSGGYRGAAAGPFYGVLPLGSGEREGVVMTAWAYKGFENLETLPPTVNAALFAQSSDGRMSMVTEQYFPSSITNGGGSVIVHDINGDGRQDIFLAAHNEAPMRAGPSVAFLSNASGTFDRLDVSDNVAAHDVQMITLGGETKVFTGAFSVTPDGNGGWMEDETAMLPTYEFSGENSIQVNPYGGRFFGPSYTSTIGTMAMGGGDFVTGPKLLVGEFGHYNHGLGGGCEDDSVLNAKAIGFVGYENGDFVGPAVCIPEYFSAREEYRGYTSLHGAGVGHTYRIFADDVNHDGALDILAQVSLWPSDFRVLQILQNNGDDTFTDKTHAFDPGFGTEGKEFDYSMRKIDLDGSGITSYLSAREGSYDQTEIDGKNHYDYSTHENFVILNDGTGRLHFALREEFNGWGEQASDYIASNTNINLYGSASLLSPRMMAYRNAQGRLNFLAVTEGEVTVDDGGVSKNVSVYAMASALTNLDVTHAYRNPVTISDRNGSKKMRTFAGDDVIYKADGDPSATVDGGIGRDKVVYSGPRSAYTIAKQSSGAYAISRSGSTDTLTNIETAQFSDGTVDLY